MTQPSENASLAKTNDTRQSTAANELPVFEGTQVPVKELHSYMRQDWNLYGFLHKFPSVSMEQGLAEMERSARETVIRIIRCDAKIASGALVFERSDVPVKRLFDYLAEVKSLKDFHWDYPSVFNEDTHDAVVTSGRILELDAYRGVPNGVVHSDRRIVSGAPLFVGTRLPMIFMFEHLVDGQTLKDFRYSYPSAEPDHLAATVKAAGKALEREFYAAAPG